MIIEVKISATGLNDSAPSDGFIDPISVVGYRTRIKLTGTEADPTIPDGSTFFVGSTPITVDTGTLDNIVDAINLTKDSHHVFASMDEGGFLVLESDFGFDYVIPSIADPVGDVVKLLGFLEPTKEDIPDLPSTLDLNLAKERANLRWKNIFESIQLTNSKVRLISIDENDGAIETAPTEIAFKLDVPNDYYSFDTTGAVRYGKEGLKFAIAKSLMFSSIRIAELYNPTTNGNEDIVFGISTMEVIVGPLTDNIDDAMDAITLSTLITLS